MKTKDSVFRVLSTNMFNLYIVELITSFEIPVPDTISINWYSWKHLIMMLYATNSVCEISACIFFIVVVHRDEKAIIFV